MGERIEGETVGRWDTERRKVKG